MPNSDNLAIQTMSPTINLQNLNIFISVILNLYKTKLKQKKNSGTTFKMSCDLTHDQCLLKITKVKSTCDDASSTVVVTKLYLSLC